METMGLNELSLKSMEYPGELYFENFGHQTALYQQRVIHTGGYNYAEEKVSNLISEMQLTSPCTMKELCKMPEPRAYNGVESFEDKILILGGQDDDDNVLDSALKFDPEKNQCHEIASLPHPLKGLATVRSKDQVIVFRGLGKDNEVHNDVFMYDCKTDKTTTLPSMLEKRFFCCAVITGSKIVVHLRSVECFTVGDSHWKIFPA